MSALSRDWLTRHWRVQAKGGDALYVGETVDRLGVTIEARTHAGASTTVTLTAAQWEALMELGRSYGGDTVRVHDEPELVEAVRKEGLDVPGDEPV